MKKQKIKILKCTRCNYTTETTNKTHTHRHCFARMHIHSWRFE